MARIRHIALTTKDPAKTALVLQGSVWPQGGSPQPQRRGVPDRRAHQPGDPQTGRPNKSADVGAHGENFKRNPPLRVSKLGFG